MSLNTFEFLAGQAAQAIRRNPLVTIAAITNVAVSLSILGCFALAAVNLHHMADLEARSAVITCELSGDVPAADVEAALLLDLRVKKTAFVGKDEAFKRIATKLGWDPALAKVMGNPLPDSILVHVADPDQIADVCADADKVKGVAKARYPEQITQKILLVARGVKIAGVVVGIVLILATLTVVSTTIRLTVYARRREIRIMQLVGATRWFIQLPFLLEGLFHGVVGGIAATVGVVLGYVYLDAYVSANLQFLALVTSTEFLVIFAASMLIAGAFFGAVGSFAGVRQHLKLV